MDLHTLKVKYSLDVYETNGQCRIGILEEVTPTKLVLAWSERVQGQQISHAEEIEGKDVLAVGTGHDLVYSGRSSWRDVQDAKPGHAERLLVITNTGQEWSGIVSGISDTDLTLSMVGKKQQIRKSDIRTVDYIRQRPQSDASEYLSEEAPGLLLFSPDTWARASGISPKLHVRIYDSLLPEDDRKLTCQRKQ